MSEVMTYARRGSAHVRDSWFTKTTDGWLACLSRYRHVVDLTAVTKVLYGNYRERHHNSRLLLKRCTCDSPDTAMWLRVDLPAITAVLYDNHTRHHTSWPRT
ncbi:hypothetical protein J6590_058949 [Homalodisca vitripennis]|nr:hypothetical protein J6590_058949 [Homalodisca vitripennis]